MGSARKAGLYWDNNGISVVECNKGAVVSSVYISLAEIDQAPVVGIAHLSEDLRLLEQLQKKVQGGNFSTGNMFLSIPSKDIIVRWFQIPWMKPEEIEGVVAFEASKYIPFPLEELIFTYSPATIHKDGTRQIGIVFTAIRKVNYDRYHNVLVHAGINLVYSEPSVLSLLRVLVFRKKLDVDKVTAIITGAEDSGEIVIVSQGQVKFIRDFSFRAPSPTNLADSHDVIQARLFNEVRMSLDFFSRQSSGQEVEKILVVFSSSNAEALNSLGVELGLPVTVLDPNRLFESNFLPPDIAFARAFGCALSGSVPSVVDLNLSENQAGSKPRKEDSGTGFSIPKRLLGLIFISMFSVVAAVSVFFLMHENLKKALARKMQIQTELGANADISRDDIETNKKLLDVKTAAFKSLSFKSTMAPFMVHLFQLAPQGLWLESLDLVAKDEAQSPRVKKAPALKSGKVKKKLSAADYYELKINASLKLVGYASLDDSNAEFELINQFLDKLQKSDRIKEMFQDIKLQTLQSKDMPDQQRASFFIIEMK